MKQVYIMGFTLLMYFTNPLMSMDPLPEATTEKQQYACGRAKLIDTEFTHPATTLVASLLEDEVYFPIHDELMAYSLTLEAIGREIVDLCSYAETKKREEIDSEFDDIRHRLVDTNRRIDVTLAAFHEGGIEAETTNPKDLNRKKYQHKAGKARRK